MSGLVVVLIGSLVVKPSVWPWVVCVAATGLVILGALEANKRIKDYRADRRALARRRHRRPAVLRRRAPSVRRRPALYLAAALIAAVGVSGLAPQAQKSGDDGPAPVEQHHNGSFWDGFWR